jgi:serine/threonine protein kinase
VHQVNVVESGELEGRVIAGKYAVLSVIGQGAMGVVYRARQMALDKVVALKVLSRELRDDAEFVMRFHTEARAASRLDHPNSTRVLDFGSEPDGLLYIAMELLQGRTLSELVQAEHPLAPARVASIMSQALSAVGAAHGLKILHRDLKPENIVILDGRDDEDRRIDVVKVCDFGIAKLESEQQEQRNSMFPSAKPLPTARATSVGVIIGTPQYMSPEQARADPLDVRSDLYSLGVVLFEMLTKRAPFDEGTAAEVLHKHVFVEPPKPSSIRPDIDPTLEAICLRALRKKPEERFATAREMRAALRPLSDHPHVEVTPPASAPRAFDAAAPTISAEPVAVAPRGRPSRHALWLLPMIAAGATAVWLTPWHRPRAPAPALTAPQVTASPQPAQPVVEQVAATAPQATISTSEVLRPHAVRMLAKADAVTPVTTPSEIAVAPMPTPTTTNMAAPLPTVTVTGTPTMTSAPTHAPADPAQARTTVAAIRADRVNVASVESALRHVDFASCYRAEIAVGHQAEGDATLALEMDETAVTRADLVGGAFAPSLRQCIVRRALTARVPNVDTGDASAKVTLRFTLR